MAYIVTPDLGLELADPATIQPFETPNVNSNFLKLEAGIIGVRDTGYRFVQRIPFTTSGSFDKTLYPWLRAIRVRMVGGGGGSGGCAAAASGEVSIGGSGSGAAYLERLITDIAALGASEPVTVGAAGAAGGVNGNGGVGGTSTFFGSSAPGGGAGLTGPSSAPLSGIPGSANPAGVPAGTFDFGIPGSGAVTGLGLSALRCIRSIPGASVFGATPLLGMGGSPGLDGVTVGGTYGTGAIGAYSTSSQPARPGAAGTPGLVILELFA